MNSAPSVYPTVGRIVHFHLSNSGMPADPNRPSFHQSANDTYAAVVAGIQSAGLLNLAVYDTYGNSFSRTSVPFVQPGEERNAGAWCEWPPQSPRVPLVPPIGEPPTLNRPHNIPGIDSSGPVNTAAVPPHPAIAEANAIRHPVIGAAQELDNNGAVINRTTSTETTDNGERRFAALDQVVESVKAHNANVPPEVIEREIDEAVTAVRAGYPVDEPGTGPFDSPAQPAPHIPQD